ncbi:PREDICTED: serine racemase-like [Propithecus coquereli]|uniref:serine racemase-like n=1 Tax=Propithecus coquereli TaxID=379532 RepID=UPI00063F7A8A|nr:PREDICTED: serine racemase-like [Propithecus coquereli]
MESVPTEYHRPQVYSLVLCIFNLFNKHTILHFAFLFLGFRTMCAHYCISFADVEKAHVNIRDFIHLTPVLTSSILNQVTGRNLFFKCELFQKTGSFKIRGALNAIRGLVPATLEGKPKAVVTHSSGNHGQALTYAAKLEGIPAFIVVPQTAPNCKKLAIQAYGASIVYSEQSDEVRTVFRTTVIAFI